MRLSTVPGSFELYSDTEAGRLRSCPEPVSATPLAIEPFLELDLRDRPGRVQVDTLSPRAPDATPAALSVGT